MDEQRRAQVPQQLDRLLGPAGTVGGDTDVARLARSDGGVERPDGLLERGLGVEAVRVEDVDVVEAHAPQALVEAAQQILARTVIAVGPRPHVVAGLGRDHQLVAPAGQVLGEDPPEVDLGASVRGAVVVGQVEVRDPQVEGATDDRPAGGQRPVVAEVLPQPERDRGQLQAAAPAAPVGDLLVAIRGRRVERHRAALDRLAHRAVSHAPGRDRQRSGRRATGSRGPIARVPAAGPARSDSAVRRNRSGVGLAIGIVTRARTWLTLRRSRRLDETDHSRARAAAAGAPTGRNNRQHGSDSTAERPRSAVEPQRRDDRRARPDLAGQPGLRRERLQSRDPAPTAAQGRLQATVEDARQGRGARHLAGRRGRAGDEGVGAGEGRHPLHAHVPAADRADRGEARQLLCADRRGHRAGRVLWQGADPGRARRLLVPHRRHPSDVRGPRLHGLGPDQPRVHPREPQRRAAVHSDRVRVLDGRGAGPQDPAAALDGRAVKVGDAGAEAVRQQQRGAGFHHRRPRAGVLPDRRAVLLRAPRPGHHRPHAVRRQAAQGPRARRPLLRLDPGADPRLHARHRAGAGQARRAGQDAPQRGRARTSTSWRRSSRTPTSAPTTSS